MINRDFINEFANPVRFIIGTVTCFNVTETDATIFTSHDRLKSVTLDRVGILDKFFGFGVTHKVNIKLIDVDGELNITTDNYFQIGFELYGHGEDCIFPLFYVTEVHRDENTNELSITAYDTLYKAQGRTVAELELTTPYTISQFVQACADLMNITAVTPALECFNLEYADGANFEGIETIYEALTAVAEATQTIFYINNENTIVFKRLDKDGEPVLTIDKNNYFTLKTSDNRRLTEITSATELGDNVTASTGLTGSNQIIYNNPFWELREDIATLLENAVEEIGGLTLAQYNVEWRGNYLLEIGDKIALETKSGDTVTSFLLNDTIFYNGALNQKCNWSFAADNIAHTNPTTIGDALKQTYARVDKQAKTIELVASENEANRNAISKIQVDTEGVTASAMKEFEDDLIALRSELKIAEDNIKISIDSIETDLENGANKVVTSTGFTFDDNGLTVSKTNNPITTSITENGMLIRNGSTTVLTANNQGVKARDLHAETYLIIGTKSRFEDYNGRTCCFWIGG